MAQIQKMMVVYGSYIWDGFRNKTVMNSGMLSRPKMGMWRKQTGFATPLARAESLTGYVSRRFPVPLASHRVHAGMFSSVNISRAAASFSRSSLRSRCSPAQGRPHSLWQSDRDEYPTPGRALPLSCEAPNFLRPAPGMQDPGLVAEIHGSERRRDVQSTEAGGPGASAITSFSQISSSTSRARRPASHALAAAICSSGGLVSTPKLELRRELGRDFGDGTLAAQLKHDRVERALRLPGKLERERGLPAAWLAVEQRAARILRKRGVKHLKGLGAAYEIVRWRREKDARRFCLR